MECSVECAERYSDASASIENLKLGGEERCGEKVEMAFLLSDIDCAVERRVLKSQFSRAYLIDTA